MEINLYWWMFDLRCFWIWGEEISVYVFCVNWFVICCWIKCRNFFDDKKENRFVKKMKDNIMYFLVCIGFIFKVIFFVLFFRLIEVLEVFWIFDICKCLYE